MAVKIKKIKEEAAILDLASSISLSRQVTIFKVPTYKDVQRIEGLLKTLSTANEIQQKSILDFYEANNLPKEENIDNSHPYFYEFQTVVGSTKTQISKDDTAVFTLKELNMAIDGIMINFSERSFLHFWLVKEEKI